MSERDEIQSLWLSQPGESFAMSIDEVRARASKLQSVVHRRNAIEYAVGGFLISTFGTAAMVATAPLAKLGCALVAIGVAVVMWRLHALARAATNDEINVVCDWSSFYRQELVRQRDALLGIWVWYLGPLIPGMGVFWLSAGLRTMESDSAWWGWTTAALGAGMTVFVFSAVASANKRAAKMLQTEIDEIDSATKS